MSHRLAWVVVVVAACTDNSNSPPVTASVSCSGVAVAQVDSTDCTVSAGTCSDGNTYVLACYSGAGATGVSCMCEIDAVSSDSQELQIAATTCAAASNLSAAQVERAWLDCGVDLTFSTM